MLDTQYCTFCINGTLIPFIITPRYTETDLLQGKKNKVWNRMSRTKKRKEKWKTYHIKRDNSGNNKSQSYIDVLTKTSSITLRLYKY